MQEEAAVTAREEEERRRHEAHLKKLQDELEAKKEAERRWVVINSRMLARCVQTLSPKDQCNAADRNPGEMCLVRVHLGGGGRRSSAEAGFEAVLLRTGLGSFPAWRCLRLGSNVPHSLPVPRTFWAAH